MHMDCSFIPQMFTEWQRLFYALGALDKPGHPALPFVRIHEGGTLCPQKPSQALTRAAFVCSKRHSAGEREEPALSIKKVHLGGNCHQQMGTVIVEHQTSRHEVRMKCMPRALFPG